MIASLTYVASIGKRQDIHPQGVPVPADLRQRDASRGEETLNLGPGHAHDLGGEQLAAEGLGAEVVVDGIVAVVINILGED